MAQTEEETPFEYPAAKSGYQRLANSMCALYCAASLKCLEQANSDKSQCQSQFDAYKACRKREHQLRLERNHAESNEKIRRIVDKLKFWK
ncbi:hypothetical protein KP509_10G074800 [Ceratopteris richardii]|uniref:CHCH domain-containing protein n=1 Tax=Ceratopteris richardii TaxID=49495 RepID=A0A8T2U699_CERRI|nr:hypothetical protein KP509_10G074800 [Ceratopteris richardii]